MFLFNKINQKINNSTYQQTILASKNHLKTLIMQTIKQITQEVKKK